MATAALSGEVRFSQHFKLTKKLQSWNFPVRIEGHQKDEEEPETDKEIPWGDLWTTRSSEFSFSKNSDIPAENNEQDS